MRITQYKGLLLKLYSIDTTELELNSGTKYIYYDESYLIDENLQINIKPYTLAKNVAEFINYLDENKISLVVIIDDNISNIYKHKTSFKNKNIIIIKVYCLMS
jgi:hypothetical protein